MMVVYVDVWMALITCLNHAAYAEESSLHSTGVGKALLIDYSNHEIEHMIKERGLTPLTPHTITTKEDLIAELEKIRKKDMQLTMRNVR